MASSFRITLNTSNFPSENAQSSSFVLNNVSWKLEISTTPTSTIDVELISSSRNKYSSEAWIAIKLVPNNHQLRSVLKRIPARVFNTAFQKHKIPDFVNLHQFKSYYSNKSEVTFEVEISTKPTDKQILTTPQEGLEGRIHIMFANVNETGEIISPEVDFQGTRWRGIVEKNGEYLAAYLQAVHEDMAMCLPFSITATFKLLPVNHKKGVVLQARRNQKYDSCAGTLGVPKFIKWNDFIQNYVWDDKANVLIQFTLSPPRSLLD